MVDAFDGRIAYLRMTTPRRPRFAKGRTSIVYRNGEKVDAARERDKAKWSNWDGSNMDPDSVARHNRSLRRAGFRDNAHARVFAYRTTPTRPDVLEERVLAEHTSSAHKASAKPKLRVLHLQ